MGIEKVKKKAFDCGRAFRAGMDYALKKRGFALDDWVTLKDKEGEYYHVDLPGENPNKKDSKQKSDKKAENKNTKEQNQKKERVESRTNRGADVLKRVQDKPFKPSSTTKDAAEQIKGWLGNETVVAFAPKTPVEYANDIAETVHSFFSEYPEVATQMYALGNPSSVRTALKKGVPERQLSAGDIEKVKQDAEKEFEEKYSHFFLPNDSRIEGLRNEYIDRAVERAKRVANVDVPTMRRSWAACANKDGVFLSSGFSNDSPWLKSGYKKAEQRGYFSKTDVSSTKSIMLHELGHKLARYTYGDSSGNQEIKDIYTNNPFILRKELSIYGSSSSAEMLAEAFAEYKGAKNPRPFAVRIGKMMDEAYKRKVKKS